MKKTMKTGFGRELKQSRGRFISIMLLMFLSTFILVGLKLVGPDIRMMANQYIDQYQLADLTITGSYGLNDDDQKLLAKQEDVEVEYGYFTDATIGDSNSAIRLYSEPEQVSQIELVSGNLPAASGEIAISNQMKEEYPLGTKIDVKEKGKKENNVLVKHQYTVVGYVNSLEILSTMDLGNTNVGTGSLNGYGMISADDFDSEVYMIARLYFDSLRGEDAFLDQYLQTVSQEKDKVEKLFENQPQARLLKIQADANKEIDKKIKKLKDQEQKLDDAKAQLESSQTELDSAYSSLLAANQQLVNGQNEITNGKDKLANAKAEIKKGNDQLTASQAAIDVKQAEINAALKKLNAAQKELDQKLNDLNKQIQQFAVDILGPLTGLTDKEIKELIPSINVNEGATSEELLKEIQQNLDAVSKELNNADLTDEEIEEYNKQIAELQKSLDLTDEQVQSFTNEYAKEMKQIQGEQEELNAVQSTVNNAATNISISNQEITNGQSQISSSLEQLNKQVQSLGIEIGNQNTDLTEQELNNLYPDLDVNQTIEKQIEQAQTNINELEKQMENPETTPEEYAEYEKQVAELQKSLDQIDGDYQKYLTDVYAKELENIQAAQTEIQTAYDKLVNGQTKINSTREQLAKKQKELNATQATLNKAQSNLNSENAKVAAAEDSLNQNQALLNQKWSQYYSGQNEYQNGLAAYQQALADFNSNEPDARSKIAKGYKQLAEAKQDVADLSLPVYTISTRSETSTSSGYQVLSSLATSIDKIANIFPLLLYAVAALVTYTTMTRYVEDERINTGTLLSLGYSEREIIRKYVVYGALSSSVGAILGIILGAMAIPTILYSAFRGQFTTPDLILTFDIKVAIIALIIALLCAIIPAFIVASGEFKLAPASLLLPKPPSAGSKIFLERITPIWKRMKFSQKVTARNIFRYKKRMFMTVFGVSGSVALLFTGLGMQGSIGNASALQYGEIIDYDMIAVVDSNVESKAENKIKQFLNQAAVTEYMPVYIENVSVESGENNERQAITMNVADNFDDYVTLRDRETHNQLELKDNEVIITERLAQIEDLKVGDSFTVQSAKNQPVDLKVGGITEMYMGHFIYATPQAYQQAFKQEPKLTSYLIKLKDASDSNVQAIATDILELDGVQTVMQNNSIITQIDNIAVSLNAVMKLIIVISGMLAIVILYNITNINVNERMRELSTTKVLGYFDNEVTMYIYRETIILSLIGIGVGYLLGHYIHYIMINTVASLNMMFDERIVNESFIAPAILIIFVSFVLGILVHQRLKKVDMLEALKSVE